MRARSSSTSSSYDFDLVILDYFISFLICIKIGLYSVLIFFLRACGCIVFESSFSFSVSQSLMFKILMLNYKMVIFASKKFQPTSF